VLRVTAQLASALDAAHARDLVHRDVKPGNVLVAKGVDSDHPEHVYLTDFGLAKKSLSLTGFTTAGEFVGTLDYVAPERIAGRPVDGRADQYSLACVVHEMLAGTPPFQREDQLELLWAHQYDPPPLLSKERPDIPTAADDVLQRALAKAADDRYGTCLEFVAALRTAIGEAAPRGRTPTLVDGRVAALPDGCADPCGDPHGGMTVGVRPDPGPPAWAGPVFREPTGSPF
jgi:serine/threonine-protein kinase